LRRFSFKRGLSFLRQARAWSVVRRLTDGSIQLEAEDGELWNARESQIVAMCAKGILVVSEEQSFSPPSRPMVSRDLSSYPEALQAKARHRQRYLQRLLDQGPLVFVAAKIKPRIRKVADELKDPNPPSPATIYRWYSRYRSGNCVVALVDRWERKGRVRKWSDELLAVVTEAIETVFLSRQRHPRKAVCEMVELRVAEINRERLAGDRLKLPSRATLYRYMSDLEAYEVAEGRLGKATAEKRYRAVLGKQTASRVLERWEIDHTPINLLVFCDKSMLPIGRPWLTIAIDKYSRMIMGFYIGFRAPSAYSVLQCIKQAILPKDELLARYPDITMPWPARGLPEALVADNGMDLHSDALAVVCEELGMQLQFCPAKQPQYKGAVERFMRTVNHDLIHRLPGTVFSNPQERGEYESERLACISFETLMHLVTKWIVEIYAQRAHRGIGMPPVRKWEIGEQERVLEYPAEPAQLDVIMGHTAEDKRVFHYGVEINCLRYNNPELQALRRRHGEQLRVRVKHYEEELGYIHVFDPDQKAYLLVEAIDQEYAAGLRLVQHEVIREKLKEESQNPDRHTNLLRKKQELQGLIDDAVRSKKMATRKRGTIVSGTDSVSVAAKRKTPASNGLSSPSPLSLLPDGHLPNFKVRAREGEHNPNRPQGGA